MADHPVDDTNGWRGRVNRWLKGTPSPSAPPTDDSSDPLPSRIGHYAIRRKLGAGGMGVVYLAEDERLKRSVALKTLLTLDAGETARKRFWREARAAASVNHPHVCQIYEVGEDAGTLFITMELLEGEPLNERLKSGPLGIDEAVPIATEMLAALGAIHNSGIVHRDLKPSNVFLAQHGVKLLDFGLARPEIDAAMDVTQGLTVAGTVLGTPGYMAPELITGNAGDVRSDLFAAGAILFEMLAGRRAFGGKTVSAVLDATMNEQPPALAGSPAVAAVDRVIRRALAKRPDERPESAEVMADQLQHLQRLAATGSNAAQPMARTLTRVVVLPFRILRADPDTDFLAFSLPDAITTSLAGIGSLIVRSSATAARFAGDAPDIKALAAEADVDRVVLGTLLRSGDQLRASTQLIAAPEGTLITSHTVQSPLGDLFQMQDDIARRVVEGLALPLAGEQGASPSPDVPHNASAYELYLKANGLARNYTGMVQARALYERCLELDPQFAPAWARLGRCHRVIGKYIESSPDSDVRAEEAFARAIALNPRLALAHKGYANLEADTGRAADAVARLLNAAARHGNDAELYAGLVHACRYAGLLDESLAAHAEARRLDPTIKTSYLAALLLKGDLARLEAASRSEEANGSGNEGTMILAFAFAGRHDEARRELAAMQTQLQTFQGWRAHLAAWIDGRVDDMLTTLSAIAPMKVFDDPEAIFQEGWMICDVGQHQRGFDYIKRAIAGGFLAVETLERRPQFDALRGDPAFEALLAEARVKRDQARAVFLEAGGGRLLAS